MRDDLLIPPQQLDAETAVLGALLLEPHAMNTALELLTPDIFYSTKHQRIFAAMLGLSDKQEPVDCVTLAGELTRRGQLESCGGAAYLAELAMSVASAANVKHHAGLVRDAAYRRALIATGRELVQHGTDLEISAEEAVSRAEQAVLSVAAGQLGSPMVDIAVAMAESVELIDTLAKRGRAINGVPTGFTDLDRLTAGWQESDLIIVAARPSMGKTSLAMGCALAAAKAGAAVVICSLEMSRQQLGFRMLGAEAGVNAHAIRTNQLSAADWTRIAQTASALERLPIKIDDSGHLTVSQLRGKARRAKATGKLDLLIVDYIGLIQGRASAESRNQEMAEISRSLKLLAKELTIPVIALSQLSRSCEARTEKRPILADLRDSGAIEQDADLVLFLYREEVYDPETDAKGIAEVLLRKHRNGPIGDVKLAFHHEYARFKDLYT